jgi:hypothetical protein
MPQFYFLSIVLNAASGYTLIGGDGKPGEGGGKGLWFSVAEGSPRLILGVLTALTGLLKVLSSVEGDIPVVGDLAPALAGFAAGFILIFEYYRERSALEPENTEKIGRLLIKNRKLIGFLSIAAAALHFLFPKVLFL